MDKLLKKRFFSILAIIFIFLGILAIANSLFFGRDNQIFWYCYSALIIIGLGFLFRSPYIVSSQINVILIPSLVWGIDFFYVLLTGGTLFGITNYFFESGPILGKLISLQHLFVFPIAIYSIYLLKAKRKDSWKLSLITLVYIFAVSRIFGDYESNLNWVFHSGFSFLNLNTFYPVFWFFIMGLLIFLTNYLLSILIYNRN